VKEISPDVQHPQNSSLPYSSKSYLRGAILAYVAANGATHSSIVREFGEANTSEALDELFDRRQLTFDKKSHKYYLTPQATRGSR
jgi:hypothetical protein